MSDSKRRLGRGEPRFLGCLLAGAAGDALGAPVEFMSHQEIRQRFGSGGIRQFTSAYGGLGTITDDTQMTLFTAEGLLRAYVRASLRGIGPAFASVTSAAYQRWLVTQGERPHPDATDDGWLIAQPALHNRRAPGVTCLAALQRMRALGDPADNNSKGCGGVMRAAPVGLFQWRLYGPHHFGETFALGAELARLTHGHPTGYLSAGFLATMVHALVGGSTMIESLGLAKDVLRQHPGNEETTAAVIAAESLAATATTPEFAIPRLGEGWVAEEALAIALYCALTSRNLQDGVVKAVNHDGDSDSTGAIAGNLLGAQHGVSSIPKRWVEQLEARDVITAVAHDLYGFPTWNLGEWALDQSLVDRYPGW